jgi:hypothetical protein
MPRNDLDDGADPQDRAETSDEAKLDEGAEEMRTFEELDDVRDYTRADGDEDEDDVALEAGDYDPDELDADDLDEDEEDVEGKYLVSNEDIDDGMAEDDPGADTIEGLDQVDDADRVTGGEDDFTNFQSKGASQSDLERLGYADDPAKGASAEDVADRRNAHTEENLDEGIEETFPASDPVSISPGAD